MCYQFCFTLVLYFLFGIHSFDPNAEMECELAVNLAIDIYPDSLDALQSKASLLLSQNKGSEAAICMANVYKQLIKIRRDSQNRTLIAEMNALDSDADNFDFPEFDFCIASAKLLIECAAFDQALRSVSFRMYIMLINRRW